MTYVVVNEKGPPCPRAALGRWRSEGMIESAKSCCANAITSGGGSTACTRIAGRPQ